MDATTATTAKERVFVYEGRQYADPGAQFSNEQVRDMLARTFGALAGGEIAVTEEEAQTVVTFSPRPQRKGVGEALIRQCRICACTDAEGCPDGCYWVEDDLCSGCVQYDQALTKLIEEVKTAVNKFGEATGEEVSKLVPMYQLGRLIGVDVW